MRLSDWKKGLLSVALGFLLTAGGRAMLAQVGDSGRETTPAANSSEARETEVDENYKYKHSAVVGKLGKTLGLSSDAAATTFEVLNFGVLAALVVFFLGKALPKTFKERNSAIQKHLVDARIATEEANTRMSGIEDRLAALDGQIAELKAQSEKDSAADEVRIKAAVEDEKAKILASADQEIAAATLHAQRQLQQYAAELAIEQAAKKLTISAETDRLLVRDFARRLGSDDLKGGQN